MNRKNEILTEKKTREETQNMVLSEIREKIYQLRKQALLNPTRENVNELKKFLRYIKDELDI